MFACFFHFPETNDQLHPVVSLLKQTFGESKFIQYKLRLGELQIKISSQETITRLNTPIVTKKLAKETKRIHITASNSVILDEVENSGIINVATSQIQTRERASVDYDSLDEEGGSKAKVDNLFSSIRIRRRQKANHLFVTLITKADMEKMKELTEEIKASHQSLELFTKYKQPIDSPYFEPPIKRNETVLDKSFLYVLNEINSKNYHLHIGYEYTVLSNAEWIDEVMENKYTSFLKAMRKRLIDILTLQGDIELKIDMEAFGNKEEDNAMSKERAREILGVAEGASNREIRKAFKRKALKKHPDKGGTKEEFVELRQALDTLVPNLRVVSLKF
jgi:hypothetical protein